MSVRGGLLAVLTLGPAYGAQAHADLSSRLGNRRRINVGQVYATLDRLASGGLVEDAGATDDGLPLYRLTAVGAAEAREWLATAPAAEWDEMLDRVLVATSLPGVDPRGLIDAYRSRWTTSRESHPTGAQEDLAAAASDAITAAAIAWLDAVRLAIDSGPPLSRGVSAERPRRGRRPAA